MPKATGENMRKTGFVALVGRSNVGKSTLLNALVGTKVAIVSPKPQTTRHAIRGIVNDPRGQIVFVDTPGVFDRTRDPLTEALNREVRGSIEGIDAIVYVVDPTRAVGPEEHRIMNLVQAAKVPTVLAVNKSDLPERERPFVYEFERLADKFRAVVAISALRTRNLKPLLDTIFELLPEGEPYYPEFQLTDIETKHWIEELIREKVFIQMHDEIPYSTTVVVDQLEKREDGMVSITARILTSDERHKKMLIGARGAQVKQMGASARRELETALQAKVYLDLTVEVDEHWVSRETHR